MAGHRHSNSLRHSGVHHVADCAPAHVVPEHPRHPSFLARRGPRFLEVAAAFSKQRDAPPARVRLTGAAEIGEDPGDDALNTTLELVNPCELPCDSRLEVRRHVHDAPLAILGRTRIERQCSTLEIYLSALETEHLLDPPSKNVADRDSHAQILGKMPPDGLELRGLE